MKKIVFSVICTQILIAAISLFKYSELGLLNYINISFYVASVLLLASLVIHTINSGFFDVMSKSFRKMFYMERRDGTDSPEEIVPLSELISFNYYPIAVTGFINLVLMLISLLFYYG
ncbi:DUF3899 domain-containing protein [Mesobacillus foraminis]|uniref:DUF3899 domain-containing protein n=1 Tax=Mesobacillus foraminis TaxID=279826 RepID=UPI0039A19330